MYPKHFTLSACALISLWLTFFSVVYAKSVRADDYAAAGNPATEAASEKIPFRAGVPTGVVTLKDALSAALVRNPDLNAFSIEIRAREARILQAGLLPNPEIQLEAEDFWGSGAYNGFDLTETTVRLSQLVELGGKRSKRKKIASLERDLARWDYESRRADVLTQVTKAFIDVLTAQEKVALAREMVDLAATVLETVKARVMAGKVSPIEETRARVSYSSNSIALNQARRRLAGARRRLATTWGAKTPLFDRAKGRLDLLNPIPSMDEVEDLISQNPDVARWATEMEQRNASLELADARKIPDPTISLGGKYFSELGESAFVFSISIPIPIFDRNQGRIFEARERIAKARKERDATRIGVFWNLAEAYRSLSSAYTEALGLKEQVLPGARSAFNALNEGYRQGKFDYLSLLDSQRTLFEAKGRYIEALGLYHKGIADVERLIGTGLEKSSFNTTKGYREDPS